MLRLLYLATLVVLQLALIVKLAPPLAQALRVDALAGLAPEGWPAMLQLFATGLAVAGAALALVFPGVALARHRRSGALRFLGLPAWAVGLALAGIALLAAAALGLALAPIMPAEARTDRLPRRATRRHRRPCPRHGRRALRRAPAPQRRRAARRVRRAHAARRPHRGNLSARPSHVRPGERRATKCRGDWHEPWPHATSGSASSRRSTSTSASPAASRRSTTARPGRSSACARAMASRSIRRARATRTASRCRPSRRSGASATAPSTRSSVDESFRPFRLDVDYFPAQPAPVRPLIDDALVHPQQGALGRGVSLRRRARAGSRFRADRRGDGPLVRRGLRELEPAGTPRNPRRSAPTALCSARWIPRRTSPTPAAPGRHRRSAGSGRGSRISRPPSSTPRSPRGSRCSPSSSTARSRTPTATTRTPGISSRGPKVRPRPLLAGYLRVLDPGRKFAEPSIGRVLTVAPYRGIGFGRTLMAEGIARTRRVWPGRPIRIAAQQRLERFYARPRLSHGGCAVPGGRHRARRHAAPGAGLGRSACGALALICAASEPPALPPMKQTFLDFEQPIAELQAKIDELRYVHEDSAVDISDEITRLSKKSQQLTKEIYGKLTAWQIAMVARHPQRPYTLDYINGLFSDFRELHGDRTVRRRSRDRRRPRALQRQAVHGARPPEGPRHQGKDLPQLRHAAPRGLSQGAAAHEARREIRAAALHVRRHARRLSRHRRGGARTVGGHRPQPLRDGRPAGTHHRHRHRRRRLRRRARDRHRRRHADAPVRDVFGDLARRLRVDPVEIRRAGAGSGRDARHHGAAPEAARSHRQGAERARGRRAPRSRRR